MGPDNQSVPDTLLFAPVTVSNGQNAAAELNGTLTLQLFPGETKLRIEDPVIATAAVPEPAPFLNFSLQHRVDWHVKMAPLGLISSRRVAPQFMTV